MQTIEVVNKKGLIGELTNDDAYVTLTVVHLRSLSNLPSLDRKKHSCSLVYVKGEQFYKENVKLLA